MSHLFTLRLFRSVSACLALSLCGCVPIATQPYVDFHAALVEYQSGTDAVAETIQQHARAGFTQATSLDADIKFSDVVLVWSAEDPTQATALARPLYVELRELRRGMFDLNQACVDYARLLATLAGGDAKDAERIDALAKTVNTNFRSARDALGADIQDGDLAIFSALAAELLRQDIQHKRREYLKTTMNEAQPVLDKFASHMHATMNLQAGALAESYLHWVEARQAEYDAIAVPTNDPDQALAANEKRRGITVVVLDRNDQESKLLDTLRSLRDGYDRIPSAHRELLKKLTTNESTLDEVTRLYHDAQRIQRLYKELAKTTPAG